MSNINQQLNLPALVFQWANLESLLPFVLFIYDLIQHVFSASWPYYSLCKWLLDFLPKLEAHFRSNEHSQDEVGVIGSFPKFWNIKAEAKNE